MTTKTQTLSGRHKVRHKLVPADGYLGYVGYAGHIGLLGQKNFSMQTIAFFARSGKQEGSDGSASVLADERRI